MAGSLRASHWSLAALIVLASRPFDGRACEGPQVVREATATSIGQFLAAKRMEVLTFVGYSSAGYENPAAMQQQVTKILQVKDPKKTLINSGATAEGIGAVYATAKQKGFTTMGILSSLARQEGVVLSPCVDLVFVVNDSSWGGRVPGTGQLSPTSLAIVANSNSFVAIGGGDVARDELLAARQAGKPVLFFPAEMNHKLAIEKARRQGKPRPTNFLGSAHEVFSSGDSSAMALP